MLGWVKKRVWHAPQTMHSVPPKNGWYVPGTHSSQPVQLVPLDRYVPFAHGMHSPLAPQCPGGHSTTTTAETVAFRIASFVAMMGSGALSTSTPSSAESTEALLLFQMDSALVMSTLGASIMVTMKSSAARRRERAVP